MNHLPDRFGGAPCVRWPPAASAMPRIVSPGYSSATNTAWFAWRPGMRLHVGEAAAEEPLGAVDRQRLGDIDKFAPAVISAAGITFGIFVGQHRALRFEHRARDDVLAGDQLDLRLLALTLAVDCRGNLGIGRGECSGKEPVFALGDGRAAVRRSPGQHLSALGTARQRAADCDKSTISRLPVSAGYQTSRYVAAADRPARIRRAVAKSGNENTRIARNCRRLLAITSAFAALL